MLEPLTTLIQSARENGIMFVYALSPGIDITYSSAKDVSTLKHKLEQVASFGCEAFALLFDDIDIELCEADKTLFHSFAAAQVCISVYLMVTTFSLLRIVRVSASNGVCNVSMNLIIRGFVICCIFYKSEVEFWCCIDS